MVRLLVLRSNSNVGKLVLCFPNTSIVFLIILSHRSWYESSFFPYEGGKINCPKSFEWSDVHSSSAFCIKYISRSSSVMPSRSPVLNWKKWIGASGIFTGGFSLRKFARSDLLGSWSGLWTNCFITSAVISRIMKYCKNVRIITT